MKTTTKVTSQAATLGIQSSNAAISTGDPTSSGLAPDTRNYQPDAALISAVVDRLRPSKEEANERVHNEAVRDGRLWAEGQATALELARLEAKGGAVGFCQDYDSSAYSNAERLLFTIEPESRRSRKAARDFWALSIGERVPDQHYVYGFVTGAMEVWTLVKSQL